jgi:hypothetical protein
VIYICIPCHNEERTIGVLLWKIRQVMANFPRDFHLLVMDDGSTDETRKVLDRYMRVLPLTVVKHARPQGYARSLEALLREAARRAPYPKRDVAVTLQADFTEDPEHIPALLKRIEAGADVVIASTVKDGKEAPRPVRWARRASGYIMRGVRWPEGVTDPLSGYRAYRIFTLRKAFEASNGAPLLSTEGWTTNVELLRAVIPHMRRVEESPAAVRYSRQQRDSRFDAWRTVRQMMRFILAVRMGRKLPAPAVAETAELVPGNSGPIAAVAPVGGVSETERPRRSRGGRPRSGPRASDATGEAPARLEGQERQQRAERKPARPRPVSNEARVQAPRAPVETAGEAPREGARKRPRRKRGGKGRGNKPQTDALTTTPQAETVQQAPTVSEQPIVTNGAEAPAAPKKRRRRGGAGRRRRKPNGGNGGNGSAEGTPSGDASPPPTSSDKGAGNGV